MCLLYGCVQTLNRVTRKRIPTLHIMCIKTLLTQFETERSDAYLNHQQKFDFNRTIKMNLMFAAGLKSFLHLTNYCSGIRAR